MDSNSGYGPSSSSLNGAYSLSVVYVVKRLRSNAKFSLQFPNILEVREESVSRIP